MASPVKPINVAAQELITEITPRIDDLHGKIAKYFLKEREAVNAGKPPMDKTSDSIELSARIKVYMQLGEALQAVYAIAKSGSRGPHYPVVNPDDMIHLLNYPYQPPLIGLKKSLADPINNFVKVYEGQLLQIASNIETGVAHATDEEPQFAVAFPAIKNAVKDFEERSRASRAVLQ